MRQRRRGLEAERKRVGNPAVFAALQARRAAAADLARAERTAGVRARTAALLQARRSTPTQLDLLEAR